MSIFDKLKPTAQQAAAAAAQPEGCKRESFTFAALPESLAELQALPEAHLATPYQTVALTVLALCAYAADKAAGTEMLNWLRGPRPLNGQEISFLNDRFRGGKTYLPFSYLQAQRPTTTIRPPFPTPLRWKAIRFPMQKRGVKSCSSPAAVQTIPAR